MFIETNAPQRIFRQPIHGRQSISLLQSYERIKNCGAINISPLRGLMPQPALLTREILTRASPNISPDRAFQLRVLKLKAGLTKSFRHDLLTDKQHLVRHFSKGQTRSECGHC